MKFSKFYAPTSKEAPKDALLASHILLTRAGYIQQLGAGLYSYLPLGVMVIKRLEEIINRHMQKAGANYCNLSFVCPQSYWDESGRSAKFGKELLRFKDRKDNDFILSPTAEEAIVALIRGKITSYKQLPINLYQIQTKFRDEARPRFGLLRAREFIMKDAYSFHASNECLDNEFENMKNAYCNILNELGLKYAIVHADSGAIGGSGSQEFMVISPVGEDELALCECGYCANIETASRQAAPKQNEIEADFAKFHTPGVKTIADLANFFKCSAKCFAKAVVKKAIYEDAERLIVFFVRGDDELNKTKAQNAAAALELQDASEEEILRAGLEPGFIGPLELNAEFFIDEELRDEVLICGANEKDYHYVGFKITSFNEARFKDLVQVKAGDKCPKCAAPMRIEQGIEVGHIFKLNDRYSAAMNATFLDENGKAKPFIMGCYGIGVSRLLAVLAECFNDEAGLKLPSNIAPFRLVILISDIKNQEQIQLAQKLYEQLQNAQINVLLDDRAERFGSKIKDFELIGMPNALIIGKKLSEGKIELRKRASQEAIELDACISACELARLLD